MPAVVEMKTFADFGITGIDLSVDAPNQQYTTCPKCSDTRSKRDAKCLTVWTKEGTWSCNHCGFGKGLSLKASGRPYKTIGFKPMHEEDARLEDLSQLATPEVAEFFKKRGLDFALAVANGVRITSRFFPQSGKKKVAIAFPFTYDGEVINYKFRSLDKEFLKVKDADIPMYNLDAIGDCEYVVITEGELDALSFNQVGITAISMPDGAPSQLSKNLEKKMAPLERSKFLFEHCDRIYVAVDNDTAGLALREEIIARIGIERCWIVSFPAGCKDANDVLRLHGERELSLCWQRARPATLSGQTLLGDLEAEFMEMADHDPPVGAETHWRRFNEHFTLHGGEVTVVTGVPLSGKSTFVDNIVMATALNNDWKWCVFSPEHDTLYHVRRLSEIFVGKPFDRNRNGAMSHEDARAAFRFVDEHTVWIGSDKEPNTLKFLLDNASDAVIRHGARGIVLDPYNYIDHAKDSRTAETDYVATFMRALVRFAQSHDVHVILVAHPRKVDRRHDGDYDQISLYSISGSAHFFNMTTNGIVLMREGLLTLPPHEQKTIVSIDKVKYATTGRTGRLEMFYDASCSRFVENRDDMAMVRDIGWKFDMTDPTGAPLA